jgi:site-specific recombinase XerD
MRDYLLLEEAAKLPGVPTAPALRASINRGEIKGIKVPKGSRMVWALPIQTVELLQKGQESDYDKALEIWKEQQRTGYRRQSQLKENTIERNEYGLIAFWDYLDGIKPCEDTDIKKRRERFGKEQSLERFTLENIIQAIAKVPREKAPTRENIYKSTMSFYRSLVYQGLRSEYDLIKFKDFKPAQNKRPRRTFVKTDELFQELLATNHAWYDGRSKYDRLLTDIILRMLYLTGMRNTELCNLLIKDVDFKDQIIYVEQGKGDKDREIGLDPDLIEPLQNYLKKRPVSKHRNVLLQADGRPLNRRIVAERVKDIANKIGEDLTPHGLRRSFITNLLKEGIPSVLVQKIAGHEHLSTTEKYDMSSAQDALNVLRNRGQKQTAVIETEFEF